MSASQAVDINLDYRPSTYFWPNGLEKHLLTRVKGVAHITKVSAKLRSGGPGDKGVATRTADSCFVIFWVNARFHGTRLLLSRLRVIPGANPRLVAGG